jgi:hypothetical protein
VPKNAFQDGRHVAKTFLAPQFASSLTPTTSLITYHLRDTYHLPGTYRLPIELPCRRSDTLKIMLTL